MANALTDVEIKKEIEDSPESLEQVDSQESPQNQAEQSSQKSSKITVWLKPTASAPIMKQKKWTVEKEYTVAKVISFVKSYMKLDSSVSIFLYVNQSFSPSLDQIIGNVYECFNINGKLVLHYSTSPAWG